MKTPPNAPETVRFARMKELLEKGGKKEWPKNQSKLIKKIITCSIIFFRHFDHKKYSQIDIAGKDIQVLQDEPHWCRRAIQVEDVMKL